VSGGGGFFTLEPRPGSLRASYRNCGGDASYSARLSLTVNDRDVSGVVVPLRRAVSISGRIVLPDGPPGAESIVARVGTTIFAEPANGDPLLGLPSARTTAQSPQFRIDGLQPGAYVVNTSGIGGGQVKTIEWQGRDYAHRPLDTTAGRDLEDVVITLTNEVTRVRGSVRNVIGSVAMTGTAVAFPADRSLWTNYGLRPARLRSAPFSATGAYSLVLPAGEYFVAAIDPGVAADWMDSRVLEALSATATRVTLAWGETKVIDLSMATVKAGR
jgi:hypothetical protein